MAHLIPTGALALPVSICNGSIRDLKAAKMLGLDEREPSAALVNVRGSDRD